MNHSKQSPRTQVLYQLEKANYYPLMHSELLKRVPRTIQASVLKDTLLELELEGLVEKNIDRAKGRPAVIYTLSEKYADEGNFQIATFKPSIKDIP